MTDSSRTEAELLTWLAGRVHPDDIAAIRETARAEITDDLRWLIDHSFPTHEQRCFIRGEAELCICGVSDRYEAILDRLRLIEDPSDDR